MKQYFLLYFMLVLASCNDSNNTTQLNAEAVTKLAVMDIPKGKPQAGDWLASYQEKYISVSDYKKNQATKADSIRHILYISKPQNIDSNGDKIMKITEAFIASFFLIETRMIDDIHLDSIPTNFQRKNGDFHQLNSKYILHNVLKPQLPEDAFGLVAFTSFDLYPDADWNYVFGQASLQDRVGVWSWARYGDYNQNNTAFELALLRNIKTAVHEIGHMFGINHCVKNECVMNGINSMEEADRQVAYLCSECLHKLMWNRNKTAIEHIENMKKLYDKHLKKSIPELKYYYEASKLLH